MSSEMIEDGEKKLSSNMEDYLETIYVLEKRNGISRITDIALELGVSKASVSKALKILGEAGYVNYSPYKIITLQKKGLLIAKRTLKKHNILKDFFLNVLYLDKKSSEEIACGLEHFVTKDIVHKFKKLDKFINESESIIDKWRNEILDKEVSKD